MPEIVEVRVTADALDKLVSTKKLVKISMDERSKFVKHPIKDLDKITLPTTLKRVYSRGKKIVFELDNNQYLVSSLGMAGRWLVKPQKHSNFYLQFEDITIYYDDARHFGGVEAAGDAKTFQSVMSKVGFCLLSEREKITSLWWLTQFRSIRTEKKVADFLMDQSRFSGIGNWLRAEILYKSKVNPHKTTKQLSNEEIETIRQNTFAIIDSAYVSGGATIEAYLDPYGKKGKYVFQCYGQVYDCNGYKILTEKLAAGRTIHWVQEVQV